MRLGEVKVGEVYATVEYYRQDHHSRDLIESPRSQMSWDSLMRDMYPVRVVETRVRNPGYKTPGVLVTRLDEQTMERKVWERHGMPGGPKEAEDRTMRAVQMIMPWSDWIVLYHERVEEEANAKARRDEENRIADARRQEQAAKRWMEQEFTRARGDIYDVMTVVNGPFGDGWQPKDDDIERLVVRRHPDGNPYLNGRYTA